MGLGLKRGMVAVEPHKTEWETAAKQCIGKLKEIVQDVALDIQHVGSTAIKNICAKPIIDIAVAVSDFERKNFLRHRRKMSFLSYFSGN